MKLLSKLYQIFNCNKSERFLQNVSKVIKFCFPFITLYLTLFAIGIARYELSLVTLHSRISYLVTMSEGKNSKYVLGRIPELQQTRLPVEPKIDNPLSILKSIYYKYDDINFSAYEDLYELVISNKDNLSNLNLNGLVLPSVSNPFIDRKVYDLSGIRIENTKFIKAYLPCVWFKKTEFVNVDFLLAQMVGSDFAFAVFKNSDLMSANLSGSNLCGVQFIDTTYVDANFSNVNLVGADLSAMTVNSGHYKMQPNLQGAIYNSKHYSFVYARKSELTLPNYHSCKSDLLPPTKFPLGFNPEEYGMIDISKI